MRLVASIVFLFMMCIHAHGQFTVSVNMGQGSYKMSALKDYTDYLRTTTGVNAKIISDFPSYLFYELNAQWVNDKNLLAGFNYNFGSTGARVNYSDYSGSINSDLLLSFNSYSFSLGVHRKMGSMWSVQADLRPSLVSTRLIYNMDIDVNNNSYYSSSVTLRSMNFALQPTITVNGKWGRLGANAFAGYNLTVAAGKFSTIGGDNLLLNYPDHNELQADWSGLRVGGGLTVTLKDEAVKSQSELDKATVSFGIGLDHGGIGANLLYYPVENVGMFAGLGYALAKPGYNVGIKIRSIKSGTRFQPHFIAMYGYNAVIIVKGASQLNKMFYSPTLGVGLDQLHDRNSKGYWSYSLLFPLRDQEVRAYMDLLKSQGVVFKNLLLPFTISVGYKIIAK